MKSLDIAIHVLFVGVLVVLYFFWGCHLDLYVTILAGLVIIVSALTTYVQYDKIKKSTSKQNKS